jgi:N6-L-threonylcarbamoyladenine synthase
MKILAIETSCDETAVSIVEASGDLSNHRFQVLSHQVASQIKEHAPFGGVVPSIAKREHLKNLPLVLDQALGEASLTPEKIDAIAVTVGPGLEPALWAGITFAQDLAVKWQKPLVPANHLEGHVVSVLLGDETGEMRDEKIKLPAIALIISGGHTELVLVKNFGQYERLGGTRDDAVGEAFDKVARLLGLPYPGGPEIGKLAAQSANLNRWHLPRPMIDSPNLDFSFSGLKTAVRYAIQKHGEMSEADKRSLACEFQDAVIEVLLAKTLKALNQTGAQSLIIGGGVVANPRLREVFTQVSSQSHFSLHIPRLSLATDNATMIAMAGYFRYLAGEIIPPEQALATDIIIARGNLPLK